ncbi:NUDIX hydrolase [Streptomyces sp. M2CJ-2]|uniref:NUDIX hydrolase n=1 Tax=Streptomyces sp. M2CJ-2 TaxID=2803948 RepID=UPI001921B69D|nr:NUDIX hydrolase [Streptomyces sp. M2CJ-2]MBL3664481.1 NUDIX hydrolase [Streptomyces sp. M2CJ-2]
MTETKPDVSAAIITDGERVLMVRRRVKEGELSWQFPAGGVEDGETAEDAAVRETLEETGLTVKAVRYIGDRVHPKSGKFMAYTACEVVSGTARVADEDELDAVAWVAHSEITDYVPYPLYDKVQAYLDDVLPH